MNFWQDKKVFVAGGAGLIGRSLIRHLVPLGAFVATTEFRSRKIDSAWRDKIYVYENFDLMRPSGIYRGYDIVFWAAAKVGGAKAIKERPMELLHYNLELASRNIKAAVDAEVDRFCYVSSSYVYPESDLPSLEGDVETGDVPRVHYGLGWIKRFIERLCMAHQLTSKTKFALVRPTAIYGPYDNFDLESCHVIPALIRKVAEKQNPLEVWGDGSEKRQFTYVDDLVEGMLRATAVYACAEPINIASPEVSSVGSVIALLSEISEVNYKYPSWNLKEDDHYIKFIGDAPQVISRRLVSTDLCAFRLGYECKTSLREGLAKTFEWYKANR